MTCVVATSRFIAADRRVVVEGEKSSMIKVFKNEHLIAAVAGYAKDVIAVRKALAEGVEAPEDLQKTVNANFSSALALTRAGRLWLVEEGELWPQSKIAAIGSGRDLALGFLAGACGRKRPTPNDAKRALRYVFRHRVDCGGRIDVRSF